MFERCPNHILGYCKSEPVWKEEPYRHTDSTTYGGRCEKEYGKRGHHKSFNQVLKGRQK